MDFNCHVSLLECNNATTARTGSSLGVASQLNTALETSLPNLLGKRKKLEDGGPVLEGSSQDGRKWLGSDHPHL